MPIPCTTCKTATKITRNTGVFTTADAGEWIRLDCPKCGSTEWVCKRDWMIHLERKKRDEQARIERLERAKKAGK